MAKSSSTNLENSEYYSLYGKRCAKYIWSCHNLIVRNISMATEISSLSDFGDNYKFLSYKYEIGLHANHLLLCKCFDL